MDLAQKHLQAKIRFQKIFGTLKIVGMGGWLLFVTEHCKEQTFPKVTRITDLVTVLGFLIIYLF